MSSRRRSSGVVVLAVDVMDICFSASDVEDMMRVAKAIALVVGVKLIVLKLLETPPRPVVRCEKKSCHNYKNITITTQSKL